MKLLALTVTRDDTTSFYRAAGIIRNLQRKITGLHVDLHDASKLPNITWSTLILYDAVFLQRPYNNPQLAKFLNEMRIPLWIDYDDNLFEIPQANNRAFDTYVDEKIQNNLVDYAKSANIITVSTAALKTVYDQLNKDVRVVPNALPFELLGPPQQGKTQKSVLWRGGDSHRLDLRIHESVIMQMMETYSDWTFVFAGYNPWEFYLKNKKYMKPLDPILYFQWLKEYAPKAMQVPLHDSFFNKCKSNIAALEGTFAGAVCLVPDWPEWQIPGTIKYTSYEDYKDGFSKILREEFSFNKYRGQALEYILDNYNLDKVNDLRVQVIKDLMYLK